MCHMNFVIDLTHQSLWLSGRALEQGIQRLTFDSSWGIRMFSLSHASDKTKNIFLYSLLSSKLTISLILFTNCCYNLP